MNFNRLFLLASAILCIGLLNKVNAQNVWIKKADFPGVGRHHAASFSIGHKGYIGTGGTIYNGPNVADFWAWDQTTNTWTQVASLPASVRWAASGFAINGVGYVAFGYNSFTAYDDLWAYSESTNSWTAKTGLTSHARYGAFSFVIGDSVAYIGGGITGSGTDLGDVWKYSPASDSWTSKTSIASSGVVYGAGFTLNGFGYEAGGYDNNNGYLNWLVQYDPVADTWTSKANIPGIKRSGATGFSLNGYGYVGFGVQTSNASLGDFYSYNDTADAWTAITNAFPDSARQAAAVFTIGDAVYIGTGTTVFQPDQNPPTYNTRQLWQFGLATAGVKSISHSALTTSYPNPATNQLTIELPANATITICNVLNQQFYSGLKQKGRAIIDVSGLSNGLYLIQANTADNILEGKFVVQH